MPLEINNMTKLSKELNKLVTTIFDSGYLPVTKSSNDKENDNDN